MFIASKLSAHTLLINAFFKFSACSLSLCCLARLCGEPHRDVCEAFRFPCCSWHWYSEFRALQLCWSPLSFSVNAIPCSIWSNLAKGYAAINSCGQQASRQPSVLSAFSTHGTFWTGGNSGTGLCEDGPLSCPNKPRRLEIRILHLIFQPSLFFAPSFRAEFQVRFA